MNKTSEFRLVRPVDVAVSGASFSSDAGGTYFDREGVLRTAPANTLRVTYDPADLSKAPYALVEQEATNYIRNNTMRGASSGEPGVRPSLWGNLDMSGSGVSASILEVGVEEGVEYIDLWYRGTASSFVSMYVRFDSANNTPASTGQKWVHSSFHKLLSASAPLPTIRSYVTARNAATVNLDLQGSPISLTEALSRHEQKYTVSDSDAAYIYSGVEVYIRAGQAIDFAIRIGLPQLERDEVTSPIKSSVGAVTRAADVVGPGAGLVYSNVPIEEPAYSAVATYDASQKVHDPTTGESYLSLSGGNVGRSLADIAFWLPMGPINRRLAFDKAVNSQSKNPDLLVYAIVPGALVSDVMLLNISGARVTVEQPASGYRRTVSLVSHEVTNWYEFYAEQPQWVGDAYFENLVPHAAGPIIIIIEAPGSTAALGCAFLGKSKVIGHTLDSLEAGVISYSSTKTDAQGNMRMVRRPNARRMSCDVYVQEESKNEVYRLLSEFTDVELAVVASSKYTMTYQYGYLGQWSVPLRRNEPVRIEFKGLI